MSSVPPKFREHNGFICGYTVLDVAQLEQRPVRDPAWLGLKCHPARVETFLRLNATILLYSKLD